MYGWNCLLAGSEDRFQLEKGFLKALRESVSKGLERFGRILKDYSKVIFSAPAPRAHREAARLQHAWVGGLLGSFTCSVAIFGR
jgi:3-hydroxy-3-methylglutaryl CoA synthase